MGAHTALKRRQRHVGAGRSALSLLKGQFVGYQSPKEAMSDKVGQTWVRIQFHLG